MCCASDSFRQLSATVGSASRADWSAGKFATAEPNRKIANEKLRQTSAAIGSHRETARANVRERATKVSALLLKIPRSTHSGKRVDLLCAYLELNLRLKLPNKCVKIIKVCIFIAQVYRYYLRLELTICYHILFAFCRYRVSHGCALLARTHACYCFRLVFCVIFCRHFALEFFCFSQCFKFKFRDGVALPRSLSLALAVYCGFCLFFLAFSNVLSRYITRPGQLRRQRRWVDVTCCCHCSFWRNFIKTNFIV